MNILRAAALVATAVVLTGCNPIEAPSLPRESKSSVASSAFWQRWGDGRAELSGYRVTTSRYGEPREGRVVLIYVTEPHDARTWVKDDHGDVPEADRVQVLKLNQMLTFRTGIYPYAVMTSVFSPVDGMFPERFEPVKITFAAQEWCGSVYQKVEFRDGEAHSELR